MKLTTHQLVKKFPLGKSLWHPLDRRQGRPQSHSGRSGEEKNSQLQPELQPYTD